MDDDCSYCSDKNEYGSSVVSGFVKLGVKEGLRNCVKNIVIECCAEFRVVPRLGLSNTNATIHPLWSQKQQNACDFTELPGGEYEIPFSFSLPHSLPQTLELNSRHIKKGCFFAGKVEYFIKATVINSSDDPDFKRLCFQQLAPFTRISKNITRYSTLEGESPRNKEHTITKNKVKATVSFLKPTLSNRSAAKLILKVENGSSRSVKGISASLYQKIHSSSNEDERIYEKQSYLVSQYKSEDVIPSKKFGHINIALDVSCPSRGCASRFMDASESLKAKDERKQNSHSCFGAEEDRLLSPNAIVESSYGKIQVSYFLSITIKMKFTTDILLETPVYMSDYLGDVNSPVYESVSFLRSASIYTLAASVDGSEDDFEPETFDDEWEYSEMNVELDSCINMRSSKGSNTSSSTGGMISRKRSRARTNSIKRGNFSMRKSVFGSFEMPPHYNDLESIDFALEQSGSQLPLYSEALQMQSVL